MESSSSAIVDFGRFCTGFLVVMGVGMVSPSSPPRLRACCKYAHIMLMLTLSTRSSPCSLCALRSNRGASDDYVHHRRPSYIWDDHKFYNVFSGRAGFLKDVIV